MAFAESLVFPPAAPVPALSAVEQQVESALRYIAASAFFLIEVELTCGIVVRRSELPLLTGDADYAKAAQGIVARQAA